MHALRHSSYAVSGGGSDAVLKPILASAAGAVGSGAGPDCWIPECEGTDAHGQSNGHVDFNAYAYALKKPRWALIYVRGTSLFWTKKEIEIRIHEGDTDPAAAGENVTERWLEISDHLAAGTTPEIPFSMSLGRFPCNACRFNPECWKEQEA